MLDQGLAILGEVKAAISAAAQAERKLTQFREIVLQIIERNPRVHDRVAQ